MRLVPCEAMMAFVVSSNPLRRTLFKHPEEEGLQGGAYCFSERVSRSRASSAVGDEIFSESS